MVVRHGKKYVQMEPHMIVESMTMNFKWFSVKNMSLRDRLHILFHKEFWIEIHSSDARRLGK